MESEIQTSRRSRTRARSVVRAQVYAVHHPRSTSPISMSTSTRSSSQQKVTLRLHLVVDGSNTCSSLLLSRLSTSVVDVGPITSIKQSCQRGPVVAVVALHPPQPPHHQTRATTTSAAHCHSTSNTPQQPTMPSTPLTTMRCSALHNSERTTTNNTNDSHASDHTASHAPPHIRTALLTLDWRTDCVLLLALLLLCVCFVSVRCWLLVV